MARRWFKKGWQGDARNMDQQVDFSRQFRAAAPLARLGCGNRDAVDLLPNESRSAWVRLIAITSRLQRAKS